MLERSKMGDLAMSRTVQSLFKYASNGNLFRLSAEDFSSLYYGTLSRKFSDLQLDMKTPVFLSFILPALYGGIHLSAWTFDFPSRTEKLIWKIACFDIMGSTFIAAILMFVMARDLGGIWKTIKRIVFPFFGVTFALFYALSRIYIVMEAFISLRHVPIGVYSTVPWSQNIPHV